MWKFYHKLSYYPKYKTLIFIFITLNTLQLEFAFSNRHWSIDFQDLLRQRNQTGISLQYCYNCVHRQSTHFSIIKWEKIAFHGFFWKMSVSVLGVLFLCKIFCTNTYKLLPKVYSNIFSGNLKYFIGLWYGSLVEHSPSIWEVLDLIPTTRK